MATSESAVIADRKHGVIPPALFNASFALVVINVCYFPVAYFSGMWIWEKSGLGIPTDFVNVWAAGKLVLDGHPALAYDWDIQKQVELKAIEIKLRVWHRANADSRRLAQIPGVGPVGATGLVMKTPDPGAYASGRHFAAWIGLTPKDHSTAGKTRLGKITRAGDERLRSVLVAGATAVIQQAKHGRGHPSPWLLALLKRKPPKLAAVALANKNARIAWKLMVTGQSYDGARMLGASASAA